jgi:hypothetical protein
MTLEEIKEAVEVIKAYRQMLTDSVSNQIDGDIKAFDIAVEAMERESCVDCISRQAVIDRIRNMEEWHTGDAFNADRVIRHIKDLPSVNPQRTGHWIRQDNKKKPFYGWLFCSECDSVLGDKTRFCSNCGARMVEPQESEGER